ncbi:MAG: GIY-YIG nuclease family protein [Candidatus Peregrinibacteria bacterium]
MYYVYILNLENGQNYVGYTTNLDDRLARHALGKACTTTTRVHAESVAFYAAFTSEELARNFERYLKSSSGFAFRNKRLIEYNAS